MNTNNGTTIRHFGNKECKYENLNIDVNTSCKYGCEFEFYINKKSDFDLAVEDLRKELYKITHADILVDMVSLPCDKDKNHCMQIKPDISLESNGIEISTPMSSLTGLKHYIVEICKLVDKYGYTNEDTGFHIHVSTIDTSGKNMNFYKFMLLCNESGLLNSWSPRENYSQNVMDVLSYSNDKKTAAKKKNKKGSIWNLNKKSNSHVEIKSIGGVDYQSKLEKIVKELELYSDNFIEAFEKDSEFYKSIYKKHIESVKKLTPFELTSFRKALDQTGIK